MSQTYFYVDLAKGCGPIIMIKRTNSSTPSGVSGFPMLATAEKGKAILDVAAGHLSAFCKEFKERADPVRVGYRAVKSKRPSLPSLD